MTVNIELRCTLFTLLICQMLLQLESTCGKFSCLDMIWKGTHLSVQGPITDSACQSTNQAIPSTKELSIGQDGIVLRYRCGEGSIKMCSALKVPVRIVAYIICKWKVWNHQDSS